MRRKRKNNGVKLFLISTAILFSAVLLMSHLIDPKPDSDQGIVSDDTSAEKNSGAAVSTDAVSPSESETVMTETTADVNEPKPDPEEADDTWAMFLVNAKNPVTEEYSSGIERTLIYESWREYYFDSRAAENMKQMLADAADDGYQLVVVSAYRSVKNQQENFDRSVQERIEKRGMTEEEAYADTLKEVQPAGYSEHNAGLAADIMCEACTTMDDASFENYPEFEWLRDNAPNYGFILRYPKGKEDITGIIYEPWHYRYVGKYYAKLLTERGITLEEYFEEMNWVDENGIAVDHLPEL